MKNMLFGAFIGVDIRLEPVILKEDANVEKLLKYYMGKNTPERQEFIIDHLVVEKNDLDVEIVPIVAELNEELA
jgi:topoisomerase-4 subunit B